MSRTRRVYVHYEAGMTCHATHANREAPPCIWLGAPPPSDVWGRIERPLSVFPDAPFEGYPIVCRIQVCVPILETRLGLDGNSIAE